MMPQNNNSSQHEGVSIVSGKGYGKAVVINAHSDVIQVLSITPEEIEREANRFETARLEAQKYYDNYSSKMLSKSDSETEISIIEMYKYLVNDPSFIRQTLNHISSELTTAETAVHIVAKIAIDKFQKMDDEYFRDRGKDIEEVRDRILLYLSGGETSRIFDEDVVLVIKRTLVLSDIISYNVERIKAILCSSSGKTSHAVIVASSNSIPVISEIDFSKLEINDGDELLVDSDNESFTIFPTQKQIREYREYIYKMELQKREFPKYLKQPIFTRDGMPVSVMSNVSLESEARLAAENGADGIGLVRTEILFTENLEFPSEEDQIKYYSSIFDSIGEGKSVYIRVMDIGGDKMARFLTMPEERNPFMGYRAVRIYREKTNLLEVQLRAILKAGQGKRYGIMFPMITTFSEWSYLRQFTEKVAKDLNMKCPKLGVLFEVPLAIMEISLFLDSISFASIGTNDLIQYLSAADRGNAKVNYLYNPIEPAFLKIIKTAIDECVSKGKPVSMCGDMATRPEYTILLLGLGLTRFSVVSSMVPIIKEIVSSVLLAEIKEETNHMLFNMKSTEEVTAWIDGMNEKYCKEIFKRYHFVPKTGK